VQLFGDVVGISFLDSGMVVAVKMQSSDHLGCLLAMKLFLPNLLLSEESLIGLLGSPIGVFSDEWMNRAGASLSFPSSALQRLSEPAYNYCTENWCISDETDSLFEYEDGFSFDDYEGCDLPFNSNVDLDSASAELKALCGYDLACLVDGLAGDLGDALNHLEVQAEVDLVGSLLSQFRFNPPIIPVGSTIVVEVTVKVFNTTAAVSVDS
jgi:hypothetical protein